MTKLDTSQLNFGISGAMCLDSYSISKRQEMIIGPAALESGMAASSEPKMAIAEQMHLRKKLAQLESRLKEIATLAGNQQKALIQFQGSLRGIVREEEFKRGIGLARTEFEARLQNAFQEATRKQLELFPRREELDKILETIKKKVIYGEHETLNQKLVEFRAYVDAAGEQVFSGQKDFLQTNFDRKADVVSVDLALKQKADMNELHDLRARLERLEMVFRHAGTWQSAKMDEIRADLKAYIDDELQNLTENTKQLDTKMMQFIDERDELHQAIVLYEGAQEVAANKISEIESFIQEIQGVEKKYDYSDGEGKEKGSPKEEGPSFGIGALTAITEAKTYFLNKTKKHEPVLPPAPSEGSGIGTPAPSSGGLALIRDREPADAIEGKKNLEKLEERLKTLEEGQEAHWKRLREMGKTIATKDTACCECRKHLQGNITALERTVANLEQQLTQHLKFHDKINGEDRINPGSKTINAQQREKIAPPVLWGKRGAGIVTPRTRNFVVFNKE